MLFIVRTGEGEVCPSTCLTNCFPTPSSCDVPFLHNRTEESKPSTLVLPSSQNLNHHHYHPVHYHHQYQYHRYIHRQQNVFTILSLFLHNSNEIKWSLSSIHAYPRINKQSPRVPINYRPRSGYLDNILNTRFFINNPSPHMIHLL